MMGERTVMQEALFYSFRIEDHVPADHLLRSIDRFVDLAGIREHLKPFYSATGRPSIDPELMIRMLIDRLLHGHPLGAAAVRGGPSQPCLSLVLPPRSRGRGARPLDLLQEPARAVPRQRSVAQAVRDDRRALHGRGTGGRRGLRGRCQPDPRRCPSPAFGAWRGRPAARAAGRAVPSISTCSTMPPSAARRR